MKRTTDEIFAMSPEQRRRLRLDFKKGSYNKPRKKFADDELIEWATSRGVKSMRQLDRAREQGDPNRHNFERAFGSWENFKRIAYPEDYKPNLLNTIPKDAKYMAQLLIQYNVWTAEKYRRARKAYPEIFPSINKVYFNFRGWSDLVIVAKSLSMEKTIDRYLELKNKLGRWPTVAESRERMIELRPLIDIHKSKKAVDGFLESMERKANANGREGSGTV